MLLTLLPLAGWAQKTNISDYTVTLENLELTYNGAHQDLPGVSKIAKGANEVVDFTTNWEINWTYAGADFNPVGTAVTNAGNYTVTITATAANENYTGSVSKVYTVAKFGTLTVAAKNPSMVYGGAAPTLADFYEIVDNAVYTKFRNDGDVATLGAPVSMPAIDVVNAGNKDFTLVAREYTNYDVSLVDPSGTLTIAQKAITVTTAAITGDFTYGDAKPTPEVADYSAGLVGTDQLTGTPTFDFFKVVGLDEVLVESAILPAGTYHVYPKGLSNSNYAITYAYAEFTVGRKALYPGMIAAMADATYNGTKQAPTLTVTDGTLPALEKDVDYQVAWSYQDNIESEPADVNPENADAFKAAGVYTVTLTVVADGNYKNPAGTQEEPAATADYTIGKKALYVKTNSIERVYDGTTTVVANNSTYLTYVGLETADNANVANFAGFTVALGDGAITGSVKGRDADIYAINVTNANFATTSPLRNNYTPTLGSIGKLTINKRAITITPNPISKNYGTADSYATGNGVRATGIATNAEDVAAGKIQVTTELASALAANETMTTMPYLKRASGEAAGPYTLTPSGAVIKNGSGTANEFTATKNYDITYTPGTFTIVPAGFTIWADDKTSVFGEDLKTLTATVDGIPAADAAKIVFGEGAITTTATAGADRATYTINIDKSKIDFSQIASLYDIDAVNVIPGNYVITPAPLKIKAKDQSLLVESEVKAASAQTIEFVTEGVSPEDQAEVIENITLAFSAATPVVPVDAQKKLTVNATTSGWTSAGEAATVAADFGIWYGGIVINADAYNVLPTANYTLDAEHYAGAEAKAGRLVVSAAADPLALNRNTAAATADLQLAAINAKADKIVTATFTDSHNFTAEKWNTMVLPFDITVADFSQKFGYAIVNTLNKNTTTYNAVHFTLCMGNIPANTPFIFKTAGNTTINEKSFVNVLIVKPTVAAGDNKVAVEADGCTFYGTYGRTFIRKDNDKTWINDVLVTGATATEGEGATHLNPYAAFLSLDNPKARIYVEDVNEDGTTAIKTLDVETMKAYSVDGWYTLNGIKLQSIPTEKGVYINNGKKVVIK